MTGTFHVVFRGDIAPGNTLAAVRERLKTHFKLDDNRAGQLFSGRPVVVKKNLDRAAAEQFCALLGSLGAEAQIQAVAGDAVASVAPAVAASVAIPSTARPLPAVSAPSASESAALAVEPPGADVLRPEERVTASSRDIAVDHLSVDSAGADVLRPDERQPAVERHLDLSHLEIEPVDETG